MFLPFKLSVYISCSGSKDYLPELVSTLSNELSLNKDWVLRIKYIHIDDCGYGHLDWEFRPSTPSIDKALRQLAELVGNVTGPNRGNTDNE
jgi:hypothetical protein